MPHIRGVFSLGIALLADDGQQPDAAHGARQ